MHLQYFEKEAPRGEYVLVIEGRDPEDFQKEKQQEWQQMSVEEHIAYYEQQGIERKEAMRLAAKDRGTSKREIYQMLIK